MHPSEILEALRERPFQPFRVFLSDGSSYDVPHPDLCMVGLTRVIIGIPGPKHPDGPTEAVVKCAPEHVTRIEPIEQPASKSS